MTATHHLDHAPILFSFCSFVNQTPGDADRLSWRGRARCARGTIESPVRIQKCEYAAELDMQTLV
jgi:hypothetical protein